MISASAQEVSLEEFAKNEFEKAVKEAKLIGGGIVVLHKGEVVAEAVSGSRQKGKDNLISLGDKWHLGSVTKSMTASMIGALVEEGVFSFEDPLSALLPDMADAMDASWKNVTLAQLLTHRAGAPANFPVSAQFNWPDTDEEVNEERGKLIAKILSKPTKSVPGEKFTYSNVGITIAGYIAEEITQKTYPDLMAEYVFTPMGMTSAGFGPPMGNDQPWGHKRTLGFTMSLKPEDRADNTPLMAPAGTVHMTLRDAAQFGLHHLEGLQGKDNVLKATTYKQLHTPYFDEYASGWVVMDREWSNGTFIWHNGTNTMWYALLVVLPEYDLVVATATNDGNYSAAENAYFPMAKEIALFVAQSTGKEDE